MRRRNLTTRLAGESGFTMVLSMMVLLVASLIVIAAFTTANGDSGTSRRDQYSKQAYNAAEAGVNFYLAKLVQDTNWWTNCYTPTGVVQPGTLFGAADAANDVRSVPSSQGKYMVELLKPPNGITTGCVSNQSDSVIDSRSGMMSIRATGSYRGTRRSIVATFKRKGFLDYLWFTDKETPAPATRDDNNPNTTADQTLMAECARYVRDGRVAGDCGDQYWFDDEIVEGQSHTNDRWRTQGSPIFGREDKNDSTEATDPDGIDSSSGSPVFRGRFIQGAPNLQIPDLDPSLTAQATVPGDDWAVTGPVHITLQGGSVEVRGPRQADGNAGPLLKSGSPPKGVIYVKNGTCLTTSYLAGQTYPRENGCGDAWVSGNSDKDITIAAAKDVIVEGPVTHSATSVVGLIANGFVRVYHPCWSGTNQSSSDNGSVRGEGAGGSTTNLTIEAAILALKNSFMVDNWDCGNYLGELRVKGAIAQAYRGTVSGSGLSHGYLKKYTYNPALRYHQPPYYLNPVEATWGIYSQTEQSGAVAVS